MRRLSNPSMPLDDQQEADDIRVFKKLIFLVAVAGICFLLGLKLGLREGRMAMPKAAAWDRPQGLTAGQRQEVVSRWYR